MEAKLAMNEMRFEENFSKLRAVIGSMKGLSSRSDDQSSGLDNLGSSNSFNSPCSSPASALPDLSKIKPVEDAILQLWKLKKVLRGPLASSLCLSL